MPDSDLDQLDGRGLRSKLEEALGQNRQMSERLAELEAREVLQANGFDLVKPEDLKGIPAAEVKTRAEKIQQERVQLQDELLRKALERQGYKGEELEDAMQDLARNRAQSKGGSEVLARARSLGEGGEMITDVNPEKVHGYDAIRAGLEARHGRRR